MAAIIVSVFAIAKDASNSCKDRTKRDGCVKRAARLLCFVSVIYSLFAVGIFLICAAAANDNLTNGTWGWILTSISGLFVLPLEVMLWSAIIAYACKWKEIKKLKIVNRLATIVNGPDAAANQEGNAEEGDANNNNPVSTNSSAGNSPRTGVEMEQQPDGITNAAFEPPPYDSVADNEDQYLPPKYEEAVKAPKTDAAKEESCVKARYEVRDEAPDDPGAS